MCLMVLQDLDRRLRWRCHILLLAALMPCVTLADLGASFSEHFISSKFSKTLSFHREPEKSYSVLLGLSAFKSTFPRAEKTVGIGEKQKLLMP